MKTEGLSLPEGLVAYAGGHIVQDRWGNQYQMQNDKPMYKYKHSSKWEAHRTAKVSADDAPFSIVLPEEKSLTFEEAIQCRRVKIHYPPELKIMPSQAKGTFSQGDGWYTDELAVIAIADSQGWKITEVIE